MLRVSGVRSASILATLRQLMVWNKTNAVAQPDTTPADQKVYRSPWDTLTTTRAGKAKPARGAASSTLPSTTTAAASVSSPARTGEDAVFSELDVMESIVRRRWSCKQYDTAKPIEQQALARVLAATTRAATGFNLQGWHAVVVTEAGQKKALCAAALGQMQVLHAPVTVVFVGDTEAERNAAQALEMGLDNGYYGPLYGSTYLRNVYYYLHGGPWQAMAAVKSLASSWYSQQTSTALITVPVSKAGYAWKQSMIPATTFVNLCTAAGWDTCMMEGIDEGLVKKVLGVPEGERYTVPVIVTVGHALRDPDGRKMGEEPRSTRFSTKHLIRWQRF